MTEEKKFEAVMSDNNIVAESNDFSRELYEKSRWGESSGKKKIQYSLVEGLYLVDKEKMTIIDSKGKKIKFDDFVKKVKKIEKNIWTKYLVFKDMRDRGYIVKTALKFGADFMVYDRGVKPGEDHAKWLLFPVHESQNLTWYDFSAKNRVAHSTRKKLLIGVVDDKSDVTYYQVSWMRP